jgi:hypothetical protein
VLAVDNPSIVQRDGGAAVVGGAEAADVQLRPKPPRLRQQRSLPSFGRFAAARRARTRRVWVMSGAAAVGASCTAYAQVCKELGRDISGFRRRSSVDVDSMSSLVENPQRILKPDRVLPRDERQAGRYRTTGLRPAQTQALGRVIAMQSTIPFRRLSGHQLR